MDALFGGAAKRDEHLLTRAIEHTRDLESQISELQEELRRVTDLRRLVDIFLATWKALRKLVELRVSDFSWVELRVSDFSWVRSPAFVPSTATLAGASSSTLTWCSSAVPLIFFGDLFFVRVHDRAPRFWIPRACLQKATCKATSLQVRRPQTISHHNQGRHAREIPY